MGRAGMQDSGLQGPCCTLTHRPPVFMNPGENLSLAHSKCLLGMEKKKKKREPDPFEFHLLGFITVLLIIANRQCELQLANCLLTLRSNNSHVP